MALLSGIYPLRYRPYPRNSWISSRLFLLFFLPPSSSHCLSLFFSISLSSVCRHPRGVRKFDLWPFAVFPVLCFNVLDSRVSTVDRCRDSKLLYFFLFLHSPFCSRSNYARLHFAFFFSRCLASANRSFFFVPPPAPRRWKFSHSIWITNSL